MGNSLSTFWCKFTINNNTDKDLFLEFRKTLFDEVELFVPDSQKNYRGKLTGSKYPRSSREVDDNYFIFKIPVDPQQQTYFLRVKSLSNISFPLSLGSAQHMFSKHRDEEFFYGLYIGLILTLILYNCFILLAVRDLNYVYYITYLLLNLVLYDLSATGFGAEFIWGDWLVYVNYYTITDVLIGIAILVNLFFLSSFLNLKEKLPSVYRVNKWFYIFSFFVVVANLLSLFTSLALTQLLIIVSCIYILFVVAFAYYKKIKRVRFLLIGWTLYISSVIIYELFLIGILPYHPITLNSILFGSSFEALFFSFALADRIRELRSEKIQAQGETLELIKNQNITLEKAVYERTQEIAIQNEEMAAQNEELLTLQDQIGEQNDDLEKTNKELEIAHKLIEGQHEELKEYATSLEAVVQRKTADLINSNEELIRQNNQLQQFSFITAHNLRAPVARILGLINVLNQHNSGDEQLKLLEYIQQTGIELDYVIKDLANILDIKKGSSEKFEAVNVRERLKRSLALLTNEIEKNKANLVVHIREEETVYGLAVYLESIFYNLLSNSLKYSSPMRSPLIEITSQRNNGVLEIEFRDNGIGIDLNNNHQNVFGLYKRFHFHTEGKGLGLHLVKTQVEAMGGTITVRSEPDKGATFQILLPYK